MIKQLLSYISNHKGVFLLAILLATGTILAGIGLMTTSGYLISRSAQRPMIVDLFMVTAGVRFFGISRAVIRYFERVVSHDLTFRILLRIRTDFYRKLNGFSQKWFSARRPAELLAGMISDIETLQNVYLRIISPVIVAGIICLITFFGLSFIDITLAVTVLAIFLINGIAIPRFALWLSRGRGKASRESQGKMKDFLLQTIQGLHDVLWLRSRRDIKSNYQNIDRETTETETKNAMTSGIIEGINSFLSHGAMFAALLLTIPLVLNGQLQGVMLAAVVLGVFSSFEALQGLANAFVQYEKAEASSGRLAGITKPEEMTNADNYSLERKSLQIPDKHPTIHFTNVSFGYEKGVEVLKNITFSLPRGSKTAIVGPTGSGKSTIINLLTGFWPPSSGEVRADDAQLWEVDMAAYRSRLGVVSQNTHLFNRRVRDNLLIAKPDAKDDELCKILELTGLDYLIPRLDELAGSQGMLFSGGERQLLALARALLTDSRIWIFDELAANLDAGTERKILNTLWSNLEDRSLLMVTHRLLDMEKMDQVLVIEKGEIAERGTHEELIRKDGIYAQMYTVQMGLMREI